MKDTNILFVDDEKQFAQAMSKVLRLRGFGVQTAFSGNEALDRFQTGSFDLVITDLKMPVMDGIQFIRHVRQINPSQKIIVITAFPTQCVPWNRRLSPDQKQIEPIEAMDCLVKPFSSTRLIEAVERCLAESAAVPAEESLQESPDALPETQSIKKDTVSRQVESDCTTKDSDLWLKAGQILEDTAKAIGEKVACALVGLDGVMVSEVNPVGFPKDCYSGRFASLMKILQDTLTHLGCGPLSEILFRSEEMWILVRFIGKLNYYLCIVADLKIASGMLRTVANKTAQKLNQLV